MTLYHLYRQLVNIYGAEPQVRTDTITAAEGGRVKIGLVDLIQGELLSIGIDGECIFTLARSYDQYGDVQEEFLQLDIENQVLRDYVAQLRRSPNEFTYDLAEDLIDRIGKHEYRTHTVSSYNLHPDDIEFQEGDVEYCISTLFVPKALEYAA